MLVKDLIMKKFNFVSLNEVGTDNWSVDRILPNTGAEYY